MNLFNTLLLLRWDPSHHWRHMGVEGWIPIRDMCGVKDIQFPEKYQQNVDVSSEDLSSRRFPILETVVNICTNRSTLFVAAMLDYLLQGILRNVRGSIASLSLIGYKLTHEPTYRHICWRKCKNTIGQQRALLEKSLAEGRNIHEWNSIEKRKMWILDTSLVFE